MEIEIKYTDENVGVQTYSIDGSSMLLSFIDQVEFMQRCYRAGKFSYADEAKERLVELLDDLMRLKA